MKKNKDLKFIYVTTQKECGIRGVIDSKGVVYGISLKDRRYHNDYEIFLKEIPKDEIRSRDFNPCRGPSALEKAVLDALKKGLKEVKASLPISYH